MAITKEQREARRNFIGSSDSAAVLGLDPYKTSYDLWLDKTGRAADFEGNEATERGNLLEPVLLTWAERELGVELHRDVFLKSDDAPCLAANLDGAFLPMRGTAPADSFVVEAKTSTNPDEWGEPGTDEIPERVLVQTHHALYVSGFRLAYVPVLLPMFGRFDFRMYRVERNDELAAVIAARSVEFWEKHVLADVPPADSVPSLDVLKRMRREPSKVIPLADALVDHWIVAKAAKKQAEEDLEECQAALLAALKDAEGGQCAAGLVTYLETKRKGYVVNDSTFRTLRLKAAKGGKVLVVGEAAA